MSSKLVFQLQVFSYHLCPEEKVFLFTGGAFIMKVWLTTVNGDFLIPISYFICLFSRAQGSGFPEDRLYASFLLWEAGPIMLSSTAFWVFFSTLRECGNQTCQRPEVSSLTTAPANTSPLQPLNLVLNMAILS